MKSPIHRKRAHTGCSGRISHFPSPPLQRASNPNSQKRSGLPSPPLPPPLPDPPPTYPPLRYPIGRLGGGRSKGGFGGGTLVARGPPVRSLLATASPALRCGVVLPRLAHLPDGPKLAASGARGKCGGHETDAARDRGQDCTCARPTPLSVRDPFYALWEMRSTCAEGTASRNREGAMSGRPDLPLKTFLSTTLLARFLAWKRCNSLTAPVIDTNRSLLCSAMSAPSLSLGTTPFLETEHADHISFKPLDCLKRHQPDA